MYKFLFRSKMILATIVAGAAMAVSASVMAFSAPAASAATTSIFATAQGTSLLGIPVPVLGTQGWTVTIPVGSQILPTFVWNTLDFTVESNVQVGGLEVLNLYLDPHMAK